MEVALMICVYDPFETVGASLGEAILSPISCIVREEAGGLYALTLVCPLDPGGVWQAVRPFALLRVPVPRCETPAVSTAENRIVDAGWQVWQVTRDRTGFYTTTTSVRYAAYVSGNVYVQGDRVRYNGLNWQCITAATLLTPSDANSSAWRNLGTGDPVPRAYLPAGEQLAVSSVGETWLEVKRANGSRGYVKRADCDYLYTADTGAQLTDPVAARTLTEQLFRVTDVRVDSAAGRLTAHALHLSYDASGILLDRVTLNCTDLPTAVAALRSAALPDGSADAPPVFCQGTAGLITGGFTHMTLTAALLDPEMGLVRQARVRLVRDNRDFFLLQNGKTDRGVRLVHGVNLRGVRWERDCGDVTTRLLPVARAQNGSDLLLPERYVDSPLASRYPVPVIRPLRVNARVGRDGMTEASAFERMRREAAERFSAGIDRPKTTLTVDFLLLGDTREYKVYRNLESLTLYDTVEVHHPDLGLSARAQVKSYEWDAVARRYTRITLGDVFDSADHMVYGYSLADGAISTRKLTQEAIEEIRNG